MRRQRPDAPPTPTKSKLKPVMWNESALKELKEMPSQVRSGIGQTLMAVQYGERPANVSPVEGYSGNSVMKIREDYDSDTYRLVYVANFEEEIVVLHAFQKKSTSGIATPKKELDTIRARYNAAKDAYRARHEHRKVSE